MMTTLSYNFHFNAAHRLYGMDHMPVCATNIHGHNFHVTIVVQQHAHLPVMDFKEMHRIKGRVDTHRDHGFLCHQDDPIGTYLSQQGMKVYGFSQAPTTEQLCEHLVYHSQQLMAQLCTIISVSIQETPTYTAHYHVP